jgi:hypothetical protein
MLGQAVELDAKLVLGGATSWWCFSTFTPMRFIVDSISERMSWPSRPG